MSQSQAPDDRPDDRPDDTCPLTTFRIRRNCPALGRQFVRSKPRKRLAKVVREVPYMNARVEDALEDRDRKIWKTGSWPSSRHSCIRPSESTIRFFKRVQSQAGWLKADTILILQKWSVASNVKVANVTLLFHRRHGRSSTNKVEICCSIKRSHNDGDCACTCIPFPLGLRGYCWAWVSQKVEIRSS